MIVCYKVNVFNWVRVGVKWLRFLWNLPHFDCPGSSPDFDSEPLAAYSEMQFKSVTNLFHQLHQTTPTD